MLPRSSPRARRGFLLSLGVLAASPARALDSHDLILAARSADAPRRAAVAPALGPLRLVVAQARDSGVDRVARAVGTALGDRASVENKPGAGGMLGALDVLREGADGRTLLVTSGAMTALASSLYVKPPVEAASLTSVGVLARVPLVLVVPAEGPAQLPALAEEWRARRNGGFSSSGNGTLAHLAGASLARHVGVRFTHLPRRSGTAALQDVAEQRAAWAFVSLPVAIDGLRRGRLRVVAVAAAQPSALLPGVPTLREAGGPDHDFSLQVEVFAPAGVAAASLHRLRETLEDALATPALRAELARLGAEPGGRFGRSPAWAEIARAEGLSLD